MPIAYATAEETKWARSAGTGTASAQDSGWINAPLSQNRDGTSAQATIVPNEFVRIGGASGTAPDLYLVHSR